MDTKNEQFQSALLRLCQSVVDVMRLANDGNIPAELAQQTVRATLEHLTTITNGFVGNPIAATESPQSLAPSQTSVNTSAAVPQMHGQQVIKYAGNPVIQNGYRFMRLASDSTEKLYKITYAANGSVSFDILMLNGIELQQAWTARSQSLPAEVIEIENETEFNKSRTLVAVSSGKAHADGKNVVIELPCRAKFI